MLVNGGVSIRVEGSVAVRVDAVKQTRSVWGRDR